VSPVDFSRAGVLSLEAKRKGENSTPNPAFDFEDIDQINMRGMTDLLLIRNL
jgi:hypothetical protein